MCSSSMLLYKGEDDGNEFVEIEELLREKGCENLKVEDIPVALRGYFRTPVLFALSNRLEGKASISMFIENADRLGLLKI